MVEATLAAGSAEFRYTRRVYYYVAVSNASNPEREIAGCAWHINTKEHK